MDTASCKYQLYLLKQIGQMADCRYISLVSKRIEILLVDKWRRIAPPTSYVIVFITLKLCGSNWWLCRIQSYKNYAYWADWFSPNIHYAGRELNLSCHKLVIKSLVSNHMRSQSRFNFFFLWCNTVGGRSERDPMNRSNQISHSSRSVVVALSLLHHRSSALILTQKLPEERFTQPQTA